MHPYNALHPVTLRLDGLTLQGFSISGLATWLMVPELDVLFDVGECPLAALPINHVLLTHAHFDHFHKPTLRKLPHPKIGVMPWGVGDLAHNLGFARVIELDWWESFGQREWKVTLTPSHHWGARTLHDHHRGYGGFVLEHQGRRIYHAGDSAYFTGFKQIGQQLAPDVALLPIGAYHPESFRRVHMGPDEAVKAFTDLGAQWLVPMHYGTFKLSFEDMDEPPRWLRQLAVEQGISQKVRILDEGVPVVF